MEETLTLAPSEILEGQPQEYAVSPGQGGVAGLSSTLMS
jgi:hypothetical protein